MISSAVHQARKGGSPADRHNGTYQHFIASVTLTGPAMDFPSFMQLMVSAHRKGAPFGKRARAAGQKNPARATDASTCQCTNTWNHPDPMLYTQQRRSRCQPMKRCSSVVSVWQQAKQEQALLPQLFSCLMNTSRASPSRPTYCLFFHGTVAKFFSAKVYGDMQSTCKDVSYEKQLICIGHSNLRATLE